MLLTQKFPPFTFATVNKQTIDHIYLQEAKIYLIKSSTLLNNN
jgi:hypothetical protein